MKFKRIVVLILTLVMIKSVCASTVLALDIPAQEEINYVSIGDSMTNGLGMEGYDTTDNPGTNNDGRNGFLEVAPDAYPAKFASWLAEYTGRTVNLSQLATSAARAEDIYYILTHGTEKAFEPDAWTMVEMLNNSDRWGDPDNMNDAIHNDMIATIFQSAVKDADIITLSIGDANFGVFFMGRLMNLVGLGSSEDLALDEERYGYMTLENAILLCEENEELAKFVSSMYIGAISHYEQLGFSNEINESIGDYFAYTLASYIVTYEKILDTIIELNPDVEIISLPTIINPNNYQYEIIENGESTLFDVSILLDPINEYITNLLDKKDTSEEYRNARLFRVELNEVQIFGEYFLELYRPVVAGEEYPADRFFCHSRFIGDIRGFIFPILFGGMGVEFNEYDVKEYEIAKVQGLESFTDYVIANSQKSLWITYYLGMVDAFLSSVDSSFVVNMDKIYISEDSDFTILSILYNATTDLFDKIQANMNDRVTTESEVFEGIYLHIVDTEFRPLLEQSLGAPIDLNTALEYLENTPELAQQKEQMINDASQLSLVYFCPAAMSEEMCANEVMKALMCLYARLKLAWGLSAHPTVNGHDTMLQDIIDTYEKGKQECKHQFTNYVYNLDATCTKDGTATAKCDYCAVTNTVIFKGSAYAHKYEDATCTSPKTCLVCGMISGKPLGHKYDNSCDTDCNSCGNQRSTTHKYDVWKVTKNPTSYEEGEQTRKCVICGHTQTEFFNNPQKQGFFARFLEWLMKLLSQLFAFGKK